jgi:TatD DNase family protein
MRYLDAHCHLDFNPNVQLEIKEALDQGIIGGILGGTSIKDWPTHQAFCRNHEGFQWTLGVHPVYLTDQGISDSFENLAWSMIKSDCPPIGIGELGLDRKFRPRASDDIQIQSFRRQLAFARDCNLPIVLHLVAHHGLALEILKKDGLPQAKGMIHAFASAPELAEQYLRLGLKLSFGGVATWANAIKVKKSIEICPLEDLLVETDSPDQAPEGIDQAHGLKMLIYIASKIAEIKKMQTQEILEKSTDNLKSLFQI